MWVTTHELSLAHAEYVSFLDETSQKFEDDNWILA